MSKRATFPLIGLFGGAVFQFALAAIVQLRLLPLLQGATIVLGREGRSVPTDQFVAWAVPTLIGLGCSAILLGIYVAAAATAEQMSATRIAAAAARRAGDSGAAAPPPLAPLARAHAPLLALGAVFLALGLGGFLYIALGFYNARSPSERAEAIGLLAITGVLPLAFFVLGAKLLRDTAREMRRFWIDGIDLEKEPWMINPEWRSRRVMHRPMSHGALWSVWILGLGMMAVYLFLGAKTVPAAIMLNAIAIACVYVLFLRWAYRKLRQEKVAVTMREAVLTLFPLLGLLIPGALGIVTPAVGMLLEQAVMISMALLFVIFFSYLVRRTRKFGASICHLRTVPAYVGGDLEVEIEIEFPRVQTGLPEMPDGPIEVELLNITAAGRSQIVNWTTKSEVPAHTAAQPGDGTLRIPLSVRIPESAREKIPPQSTWSVGSFWTLRIRAPFRSVDYSASFTVPVYLRQPAH